MGEGPEPRDEPLSGDRLYRDDAVPSGQRRWQLGDAVDLGEDALHLLEAALAPAVKTYDAMTAVEERDVEIRLRHRDTVGAQRPG